MPSTNTRNVVRFTPTLHARQVRTETNAHAFGKVAAAVTDILNGTVSVLVAVVIIDWFASHFAAELRSFAGAYD